MAKIILMDWQRGKIPYFIAPPFNDEVEADVENKDKNKDVRFIIYPQMNINQDTEEIKVINEYEQIDNYEKTKEI